ncbi:MAG: hypothetical protein CL859_09840 [Cyanobium sp. ARS6]|nr:hypothetical protein [Cyanobium sp. ARS6]
MAGVDALELAVISPIAAVIASSVGRCRHCASPGGCESLCPLRSSPLHWLKRVAEHGKLDLICLGTTLQEIRFIADGHV